jgi:hypothetical protein
VALKGIFPHEIMRWLNAMAGPRRAVVERHVLMAIPSDAVSNERPVSGGRDALATVLQTVEEGNDGVFKKQGVYWIDSDVSGHRKREHAAPNKRLTKTVMQIRKREKTSC